MKLSSKQSTAASNKKPTMASNQAAWLDGAEKALRIESAEVPKPGSDEIVVKNAAIAINPVDCEFVLRR